MKPVVMCSVAAGLLLAALLRTAGATDSLTVAGRVTPGAFAGYENGRIVFQPDKGKRMQETPFRVSRLTLEPARAVTVFFAGSKKQAALTLKGFAQAKFLLDDHGQDVSELAARVVRIVVAAEPLAAGGQPLPADALLMVDLKNLGDWMQSNQPTPAQSKAYARYRAAREQHDAFQAVSSQMVQDANRARGAARTDLLDKLRARRSAEVPLLTELKAAQKVLLAAFPEIRPDAPAK